MHERTPLLEYSRLYNFSVDSSVKAYFAIYITSVLKLLVNYNIIVRSHLFLIRPFWYALATHQACLVEPVVIHGSYFSDKNQRVCLSKLNHSVLSSIGARVLCCLFRTSLSLADQSVSRALYLVDLHGVLTLS